MTQNRGGQLDEPQESLFLTQLRQEPSGNNVKYSVFIRLLPHSFRPITIAYFVSFMSPFFQKSFKTPLTVCVIGRPILPLLLQAARATVMTCARRMVDTSDIECVSIDYGENKNCNLAAPNSCQNACSSSVIVKEAQIIIFVILCKPGQLLYSLRLPCENKHQELKAVVTV